MRAVLEDDESGCRGLARRVSTIFFLDLAASKLVAYAGEEE